MSTSKPPSGPTPTPQSSANPSGAPKDPDSSKPVVPAHSQVSKPLQPAQVLPVLEPGFTRPYRLHIGHAGGGANASLNRMLNDPNQFPNLYSFGFPFLSGQITSLDPQSGLPCVSMELLPGVNDKAAFRCVGYARPGAAPQAANWNLAVERPGAAVIYANANNGTFLPSRFERNILIMPGTSPFVKGPILAEIMPRFDFRFEGGPASDIDIYLCFEVTFSGQGYGYH